MFFSVNTMQNFEKKSELLSILKRNYKSLLETQIF